MENNPERKAQKSAVSLNLVLKSSQLDADYCQ